MAFTPADMMASTFAKREAPSMCPSKIDLSSPSAAKLRTVRTLRRASWATPFASAMPSRCLRLTFCDHLAYRRVI